MTILIETDRLILREILPNDIEGMFALDSDPEVHRYLGNSPVQDKQDIVAVIDYIRKQYEAYGIGRWAVVDKQTNDFIGWAGLKFITETTNGYQYYYDLGYRLIRRFWGQGIATEAALACIDYGFNQLGLPAIHGVADCQNIGSNRILSKIGFDWVETFDLDGTSCNWYTHFKPLEQEVGKTTLP
ncbi:GNAT family N-acetyltransferase [Sphingobacterium griseoflavum]|uniref:N-acetyltransferase n=1 Tax=Sphingobacterium griseoflavum TaxID=1474952 RepID=A0ABQ3HVS5_9SPHI|nr:GNAT family N-acetyltransferase [Sphingobacterium griseoflavum]GHE31209.1 N-acetyltransferase [Sphingobacterium griseoflavum]